MSNHSLQARSTKSAPAHPKGDRQKVLRWAALAALLLLAAVAASRA